MFNISTLIRKAKTSLFASCLLLAGALLSGNVSAQYCTPVMQYHGYGMGAKNVTFGNSFNYTHQNYNTTKDYWDEYNDVSGCVTAGSSQYMSVTVWPGNYPQAVVVWIDWNKNSTFEASEIQMDTSSIPAGNTLSDSITIPSGQGSGDYRMRVMVDYYYYYTNGGQSYDPCNGWYYGDYCDFKITVVGTSGRDLKMDKVLQPTVLNIGNNNTVQIQYRNAAGTDIDSFRAGYAFNGGSPVIEKVTKHAAGNALDLKTCETDNYTFSQNLTVGAAGNYTMKVWVSHVNGTQADDNTNNDTLTVTACTALSGTYTIDGTKSSSGSNYANFKDAVKALNQCGISGPVIFNVAQATYTESISIGAINGSSSTNTVTFSGKDSTYEITNSTGVTVELDGADYVTFRNMTIRSTATSAGGAVRLTSHADHNTFDSTWLIASNTNYGVVCFGIMGADYYTAGEFGDYNTVSNSYLEGGYINTVINGDYNTKAIGNSMLNSTVTKCGQYLLFIQYQDTLNILDNIIDVGTSQWGYAVYISSSSEVDFMRNHVYTSYMGLYMYNNDYLDIVNNTVICTGYYAAYSYYNDNVNVWHNSIINTYSAGTGYAWYQYQGTGYDFRNNIMVATGSTTYALYSQNAGAFTIMEHNLFSALNSSNYVFIGQAYTNKAALKGANSLNNIVYDQFPNWVSSASAPYDLHLTTAVQALSGDGTTGVTDDVDGDARCTFAPSIGSDESKFPLPAPVSNFTIPDTAYLNSPFNCLNSAGPNDGKAFDWFLNGSSNSYSTARNIVVSFSSTGLQCVTLETKNCTATHDTTKCVFITTPPTKPAADFIADKNSIEPNDVVMLTDLSTVGPTNWDWQISPGTLGVDWDYDQGTTSSSQHPAIIFYTPGTYEICLVASNSQGYDTVCKAGYVEVLSVDAMCQNTVSYSAKNNFYDDGGKGANYALNQTCTFLIDPCASSVTLSFKKFQVNNGVAFLRIYDGSDNKGKPFHTGNGFTGTNALGPFTAVSGKIYMEWRSGTYGAMMGWEASWTSTPGNQSAPSSSYNTSKTGWVGGNHTFTVKNFDPNASYEWHDCQGNVLGNGSPFVTSFQANGQYTICLTATNCAGTTTTTDTITVYAPTAAPTADFMANVSSNTSQCNVVAANTLNIQYGDTVQLLDLSNQGASQWAWDATPSADVVWIDAVTDQNPRVTFKKSGFYAVMLDATNGIGTGSVTKNNFIRVLPPYCTPAISQTVSDLGITRVKFATIDNVSTVNVDGFTDYSRGMSSCVDRGAKYPILVSRATSQNPINRKVWVDWNQDGDYVDAGETVASQSSNTSLTWTDTIKVPTTATLGATRMRVGVSFGQNSNTSCGPNNFGEYEEYALFVTSDVTPPVITLLGVSPTSIEKCQTYTEAGATAWDAVDGPVTATLSSNTVNTAVLGTYTVTYTAVDAAGNQAVPVSRTVTVTPDNVGPIITLNGSNPMNVDVNTSYTEPGASADDACDGKLPASSLNITGSVNTAQLGTYTLTYNANDLSGNAGVPVTRTVVVGVFTPPTITLTGGNPLTWPVGTAFVDPGATPTSNYYTSGLTVNSNAATAVNTNLLGTYTITYTCTDPSGNTGTTTRTVNVTDAVAPTINVIGGETLTVEAKASGTWADLGAYAMDNYYPNVSVTPSGSVDLSVLSTIANPYQMITYTATDGSGNTATKTRYVEVKKTTKPVINLTSTKVVHTLRWRAYNDAGATTSDSYYSVGQLNSLLTFTNSVNIQVPGVYTYVYHLTDPSGNTADDATRIVIVDENIGISGVDMEKDVTLFPNPTTGVFNITMPADAKDVSIKVMNALGQTVKVVEANKVNGTNLSVDMTGNASGMYFVAITNGDQTTVKKLKLLGN